MKSLFIKILVAILTMSLMYSPVFAASNSGSAPKASSSKTTSTPPSPPAATVSKTESSPAVQAAKAAFTAAQARGDSVGMATAHQAAETARNSAGYSSDASGSNAVASTTYYSPTSSSTYTPTASSTSAQQTAQAQVAAQQAAAAQKAAAQNQQSVNQIDTLLKMAANSAAWNTATTQTEKDALHAANVALSAQLSGSTTYNSSTGSWTGTSTLVSATLTNDQKAQYATQLNSISSDKNSSIEQREWAANQALMLGMTVSKSNDISVPGNTVYVAQSLPADLQKYANMGYGSASQPQYVTINGVQYNNPYYVDIKGANTDYSTRTGIAAKDIIFDPSILSMMGITSEQANSPNARIQNDAQAAAIQAQLKAQGQNFSLDQIKNNFIVQEVGGVQIIRTAYNDGQNYKSFVIPDLVEQKTTSITPSFNIGFTPTADPGGQISTLPVGTTVPISGNGSIPVTQPFTIPVYSNIDLTFELHTTAQLKMTKSNKVYNIDDNDQQDVIPVMKSGYGFGIEVNTWITASCSNRSVDLSDLYSQVTNPTSCYAELNGQRYNLIASSSTNSPDNWTTKFILPINSDSSLKLREVLTPDSLSNRVYDLNIYIEGANTPGKTLRWCIPAKLEINGSKHDDDYTN